MAGSTWWASQNGTPVRLLSRGTAGYHWHVIRPRAQPTAGDQRINSFGIGGDIEIRSGLLTQKQAITGSPVHFGLGTRTGVDVTRIVWPNGIMQADFDRRADEAIVAEQRLKGSCPWVFADDGTGDAVRDRLPVAIAARPSHQRAGHGRRDADRRLGEDSRRSAGGEERRRTTCASRPSCGKRTSSITCR